MSFTRRSAIGILAMAPAAAIFSRSAFASEPETFQANGLAIHGYDPVAYFTEGKPVMGSADYTADYKGATWQFASTENLAAFEGDPMKYSPRFGGYCAYAAARGYLAPTVPEAWTIHEDQLYLNYSLRIRDRWSRDISGNIAKGEANWPGILG